MSTLNLVTQDKRSEASSPEISRSEQVLNSSYRDLPGLKHETKDVLKQLNSNIRLLEDMSGRLSFVLSEVRSLIRR